MSISPGTLLGRSVCRGRPSWTGHGHTEVTGWLRTMTVVVDAARRVVLYQDRGNERTRTRVVIPFMLVGEKGREVFSPRVWGAPEVLEKRATTWYVWSRFQLVGRWSPGMEREGGSISLFLLTLWLPLESMVLKHSVSPHNYDNHGSDLNTRHQQWCYKCYLCLFKPGPTIFAPPPCSVQVTVLHTLCLEEVTSKG